MQVGAAHDQVDQGVRAASIRGPSVGAVDRFPVGVGRYGHLGQLAQLPVAAQRVLGGQPRPQGGHPVGPGGDPDFPATDGVGAAAGGRVGVDGQDRAGHRGPQAGRGLTGGAGQHPVLRGRRVLGVQAGHRVGDDPHLGQRQLPPPQRGAGAGQVPQRQRQPEPVGRGAAGDP